MCLQNFKKTAIAALASTRSLEKLVKFRLWADNLANFKILVGCLGIVPYLMYSCTKLSVVSLILALRILSLHSFFVYESPGRLQLDSWPQSLRLLFQSQGGVSQPGRAKNPLSILIFLESY